MPVLNSKQRDESIGAPYTFFLQIITARLLLEYYSMYNIMVLKRFAKKKWMMLRYTMFGSDTFARSIGMFYYFTKEYRDKKCPLCGCIPNRFPKLSDNMFQKLPTVNGSKRSRQISIDSKFE